MKRNQLYINGEWVLPSDKEYTEVLNPATEEKIGEVALGTKKDIDYAVSAAKEAFETWSQTSLEERISYMEKIFEGIRKNQQRIADQIIEELGSSRNFVEKLHAIQPLNEIKATIEEIRKFDFVQQKDNAEVVYEGYGVVACITPWNFPINQIQRKITPAILAGNTVVVQPPTNTPLTALIYAEIIHESGLPKGVFNLVTGKGSVIGDYLADHPDVDAISFTGSTEVGEKMMEKASHGIKHLVLELGGKSPLIYLKGGDLKYAVMRSMDTVLNNQGQTCSALTRLLVPEEEFEKTKEIALDYYKKKVRIGNPSDRKTVVGPLVSEKQLERVLDYIDSGVEEGAELLIGGKRIEGKGYFMEPAIFVNVNNNMKIAQEEIFGPVLSILTYKTAEEAIEIANDVKYGLSGAVVGPENEAVKIAQQIRTGNIFINKAAGSPYAPFGGFKQSGFGRESGIFGVMDYLQPKAIFR